jgi:arylamine N-acetyltransferase
MRAWMRPDLSPPHRDYLRLLGVAGGPTGLDGLRDLVGRHVRRVPFENVSKLLLIGREGKGRLTTLDEFLDGIEHHDLGGTCYTSNPFLFELLVALGYDADLLGADMSSPNVHTSIRVRVDGRAYHVDTGYAAPFFEPMALDDLPRTIPWGGNRYVLERRGDAHEVSIVTDGPRRHGYVVRQPPRQPSFFHPIVMRSFEPGRTFMRCLRITRYFDDRAVELRNRRLLHLSATSASERIIESLGELRRAMDDEFLMPRCDVETAVATLERLNQRDFFCPEPWRDSTD